MERIEKTIISKVIVVTGSSSGIGHSIASFISSASNHKVIATVRSDADRRKFAEMDNVDPFILDITSSDDIRKFADYLKLKYHRVDILINNAGITGWGAVMDRDMDYFRKVMDVNLFGQIAMIKELYPLLIAAGGNPIIINMSSQAGNFSMPFWAPYHMSKWALESFSVCLRRELLLTPIKVVVIQPGAFSSDAFSKEVSSFEDYLEKRDNDFRNLAGKILRPAFYRKKVKEKDPLLIAKLILKIIDKRVPGHYYQPGKRIVPDLIMQILNPWILDFLIRKKLKETT